MLDEIGCRTCKFHSENGCLKPSTENCLQNPDRGIIVKSWWVELPRRYDFYYAKWEPKEKDILPEELFEI